MKLFRSFQCFLAFAFIICTKSESEDYSYTKHCSFVIPPYNTTTLSYGASLPSLSTSYFTGGDWFERFEPDGIHNHCGKDLKLRLRPDHYQTTAAGVFKVDGFLYFTFTYRPNDLPERGDFRFPMTGFWSEKSRKLCMVGSTSLKAIDVGAVLKLKFDDEENPTIYTAVVSGSLESTAPAGNPAYFDPILIFSFPPAVNYNYSLVSEEIGAVFPTRKGGSLSLDSVLFCSVMQQGLYRLEMEYAAECAERRHRCSPIQFMPNYLSLTSIQCEKGSRKARFLTAFGNYSSTGFDSFPAGSTAIGEAWWDEKSNRINGVVCRILNPSLRLGNAVGDCTMRLSLNHPSVLTLRNDAKIDGEIWSSKATDDPGNFPRINLAMTDDDYFVVSLRPDQRYKYTELDRARKSCKTKTKTKTYDEYPDAQSDDMRFDLNIKNGDGRNLAWATATPGWVENVPFKTGTDMLYTESAALPPNLDLPRSHDISWPTRIGYRIMMQPSYSGSGSGSTPTLDWPVPNRLSGVLITAEGVYDSGTGRLCMVGCRKLMLRNSTSAFKDCELVVELEMPMLSGEKGRLVNGIVRSTRHQSDSLHFDDLTMESAAYNRGEAERSLSRMELEIAMVLVSNALVCIFVGMQIFHVRRNPEAAASVSLAMVMVLSAGHVIPLVLNFEESGNGGRLEANEVAVRVISMVTLLLQLRLLQLVYAASKRMKNSWSAEMIAGFLSIAFYVIGGLHMLAVRKIYGDERESIWRDLRCYGGEILDGFLLPQILLNMAKGSAWGSGEKGLSRWFYVGMSGVRLVPHVYNQYRARRFPEYDLETTYYYANPAADVYSTAWDIVIPFGIIAFAVIVFLQQRECEKVAAPEADELVANITEGK